MRKLPLSLLLVAAFTLSACNGAASTPNATLTALSAAVGRTATASGAQSGASDSLATAQAAATATSAAIQATQTAQVSGRSESQLATATVAAPILAELPQYGLDASSGHAAWLHDPLTLEVTGYHQTAFGNDYKQVTAADFVLAADITWDTQYGASGCGFMFRSNGNQNSPSQYMIIISRFANGRMLFTAVDGGELANMQDFYPKNQDNRFDWQNQTTNRLAVVARGNLLDIYTNHSLIGTVDTTNPPGQAGAPPKPDLPADQNNQEQMNKYQNELKEYQDIVNQSNQDYSLAMSNHAARPAIFTDGFLGFLALSESGRTSCQFSNAWLWILEP